MSARRAVRRGCRLSCAGPVIGAIGLYLAAALGTAGLAAPPANNNNTWRVTLSSGADILINANQLQVTAAGGLMFTIILGAQKPTTFVVESIPPGGYQCVRAVGLTSEDGASYHANPPIPAGCS